jgi:hypothetical protein
MNCAECQEHLLAGLDRAPVASPEAEQHLRECAECRATARAARTLVGGLTRLPAPRPPAGLADSITAAVLHDQRSHRLRLRVRVVVLALAASLLVALGLSLRWLIPALLPVQPEVAKKQPEAPPETPPEPQPVPSLQDSAVQAGTALSALTARTAESAVERTWALVPKVPVPSVDPMALQSPVEAPTRPFVEAGQTLSACLEPVKKSAWRAANLLWRDLAPVDLSEKPGL